MIGTRRIFITGGASGLGRALALHYARQGWQVAIGDINDERGHAVLAELKALHKGSRRPEADPIYQPCDVRREHDLQAVADLLTERWGGLDVLVNNAGVAQAGAIDAVPLSDWQWIIDINLLGVVRGCKVFVPLFKAQGHGHIVNIASMAGLLDVPYMASYNTVKAGVIALSGTLEQELKEHHIDVSVVCPSFFKTHLDETMRTPDPQLRQMMQRMLARGPLSAEQVAEIIAREVARKTMYILPHADGRLAWRLKRHLPHGAYFALFRKGLERMRMRGSQNQAA